MKRNNRFCAWFGVAILVAASALLVACSGQEVDVPSDEQVKAAYNSAVEAYGWFDMTTMPCSMETAEYNGMTYNKVDYEGITTFADLEVYLRGLFGEDVVQTLLADNTNGPQHYADIDGVLYALEADRGADITKGEETLEITHESDAKIICHVTVEVLDPSTFTVTGSETHDFAYENVDGSWVFTNFGLVR